MVLGQLLVETLERRSAFRGSSTVSALSLLTDVKGMRYRG